jgi:CRP-like cAMP-binding protein
MVSQTARHDFPVPSRDAHPNAQDALAPLLVKLQRIAPLSEDDLAAIRAWPHRTQIARAGAYLLREGQGVSECCVVLDGHAFRSKLSGAGHRQIVSFHMDGDIVDLQHVELSAADHNVQALNDTLIAWISIEAMRATIDARPAVARALWRDSLIDGSIFREWILNVGRRDARTRIAHLLCELIYRREGAAASGAHRHFELPMTQEQIGDATALTPVHVNRMLQHLESERLIERDRRTFRIQDWNALCRVADFDPAYLHHR